MKKITILLIVVLATSLFAGEFPKVDVHGRFQLEMDYESNLQDYTDFKDNNFNDNRTLTQGRVDLTFDTHITDDILVKFHTRLEGDGGAKWIKFNSDSPDKIKDSKFKLQQAYVQYDNLFWEGFSVHLGNRLWNYGGGNIFGPADFVGGAALMYKKNNWWVDVQAVNLKEYNTGKDGIQNGQADSIDVYSNIEEDHQQKIIGIIGGMNKIMDMADVQGYFFRKGENVEVAGENKTECDAVNVIGARCDAKLMDDMLMPYFEFAMQTGANDATEVDYSGMMIDAGINAKMDLGFGKIMPRIELLYRTGDDNETADECEAFTGVGMGNVEVGYNAFNIHGKLNDAIPHEHGLMMINIGTDFTMEMIENATFGFNFWMFNDTSEKAMYDEDPSDNIAAVEVSGENMLNQFELFGSYKVHKNACFYTGLGMLMPNKDYKYLGEDTAMVMWLGTKVTW